MVKLAFSNGLCFLTKEKETIYFGVENGQPVIAKNSPICTKAAVPAITGSENDKLYCQQLDIKGEVVHINLCPEKLFNLLNEVLKSV